MPHTTDKTFGQYDPSLAYDCRTEAYLVIVRDGLIAALPHKGEYRLPGGVVRDEETHEECLLRACLERVSYDVRVDELITSADAWDTSGLHRMAYFYSGEWLDCYAECDSEDARLCWISVEELTEPMQHYAVLSHMNRKTSAAALSFIDGRHHILDGPLSR